MWWLPQTSSYSYPRVTAIRIDVHPAGENLNNMSRTLPTPVHVRPTYASCGQSPYVTTFYWLPWSRNKPLHLKEDLTTKDRLIQLSYWAVSFFLSCDNPRVGERSFYPMVTQLLQLTGPISPACDQYVQYLLAGVNPSVFNRHRWGYNLGGAGFPHITLRPSQLVISTFHLRVPPGLKFNQVLLTKPRCRVWNNLRPPRGLLTTQSSTVAYIYAYHS
jgi:hypothetical protein